MKNVLGVMFFLMIPLLFVWSSAQTDKSVKLFEKQLNHKEFVERQVEKEMKNL